MPRANQSRPTTVIDGMEYRTWQQPGVSWVEYEAEEPWTVTLGFTDIDGALELAEIHVFPTRDDPAERSPNPRLRKRGWGEWSRDYVPGRGITSRGLRRMVKVDGATRAALKNVPRPDDYLAAAGFVAADRQSTELVPRRQRDPVILALVAVCYERAVQLREPIPRFIADELTRRGIKCSLSSVPNLVSAARVAGFLSPTKRGRKSGKATDKANELLKSRAHAQRKRLGP